MILSAVALVLISVGLGGLLAMALRQPDKFQVFKTRGGTSAASLAGLGFLLQLIDHVASREWWAAVWLGFILIGWAALIILAVRPPDRKRGSTCI